MTIVHFWENKAQGAVNCNHLAIRRHTRPEKVLPCISFTDMYFTMGYGLYPLRSAIGPPIFNVLSGDEVSKWGKIMSNLYILISTCLNQVNSSFRWGIRCGSKCMRAFSSFSGLSQGTSGFHYPNLYKFPSHSCTCISLFRLTTI